MRQIIIAFLLGTLFSGGLIISGMTNPAKVQNFLDPLGQWDPSLAFVMAGGLIVSTIGWQIAKRRQKPLNEDQFYVPTSRKVTRELIIGSTLFGAGWGIAGLCPGPAVAILPMAPGLGLIFFVGLYLGMSAEEWWEASRQKREAARA